MITLLDIFQNDRIWNPINPQLKAYLEDNPSHAYFSSRSRTLENSLNSTLGQYYYNDTPNAYIQLTTLIRIITNRTIKINAEYLTISSDDARSLTIASLQEQLILSQRYNNNNTDTPPLVLNIVHVPKGKSYLNKLFTENANFLTSLTNIEQACKQDSYHFCKIFRDFFNTGDISNITVFTDIANVNLIAHLIVMLPNLYNIVPIEINTTEDNTEEQTAQLKLNNKINALRDIFELTYNLTQSTGFEVNCVQNKIATFLSYYNFQTAKLNNFIEELANAQSKTIVKNIDKELIDVNNAISEHESQINSYYLKKRHLEQQRLLLKKVTPTDVQPFLDTLTQTPAIEVISSSNTRLKLRVTAPLQYFTPNDFEYYERNSTSDYNQIYANMPTFKKVLHKVFVTREYQLINQAVITLDLQSYNHERLLEVRAQTHDLSDFTELPNPHLWHHDCWSAAKTQIYKHLVNCDYELVLMQIIAAVQSINIAEYTSFVRDLLNDIRYNRSGELCTFIDDKGNKHNKDSIIAYEKELEHQQELNKAQEELNKTETKEYQQVEITDDDAFWDDVATATEGENNETN